jgi:O-antigen/teichoic acid export membrane protein
MNTNGAAVALSAVCSVSAMLLAWALGGGVVAAALAAALGPCAALGFVHVRTARDATLRDALRRAGVNVSLRRVRALAVQAAPLGLIVLLNSLQQNVPRYFVEAHGGVEALGIFAAASQLTSAGMILVSALTTAALPRFAALCAAGDTAGFRGLCHRLTLVGAILGVGGVGLSALFGREILALVYRPDFAAGSDVLVVLSVAAAFAFMCSVLGFAVTAARLIAFQPVLLALTLGVLAAFCVALVPRYGALGGAWALVVASAVQVAGYQIVLLRYRAAPRPDGEPMPTAAR